jgi:hypothetical protein
MPPWARIAAITGIVVGLTGSITGVRASWPVIRYVAPATLVYVDGVVDDVIGKITSSDSKNDRRWLDLQIDTAERSRRDETRSLNVLKLEQLKPQYKADDASRNIINNAIQNSEDSIHKLDQQLRTLNRLKGQGQ